MVIERHLSRLRARHTISAAEEQALRGLVGDVRLYQAGVTFIHAGELLSHSTLMLDGLVCRYKDLPDGQRQISELHVAGDFADLHSYTLKKLDHNMMTLAASSVALVPHERVRELTREFPRLADIYWFSTNLDAAIHREWVLSLGVRTALARMAALFCELEARLGLVGLTDNGVFDLPLSQMALSECLGLTPVHVNRMLKELRERGLVTFRSKRVIIHDLSALRQVAEFDPAYLYLNPPPL